MGHLEFIITLIFTYAVTFEKCHCSEYLVQTEAGLVQGLQATDGDYVMFLGIPYARVNMSNPFGASIQVQKFNKVYQAYDDFKVCPQIDEFSKENFGTLDCLRLNIYVPKLNKVQDRLAVLVHFYGGYFKNGGSARRLYGPKYLVRHGVIVVTFNYRVGPYGFLCLDTPEVPGNQGLKDQYDALRWIKNNIAEFGGNSNNITVLGHSSGAQAAEFHLLSNQPFVFNKLILQSSSALYPLAIKPSDRSIPIDISKNLGFITNDTYKALEFIRTSDVKSVIAAVRDIVFGVCIEKEFPNTFRMVSEHPELSRKHLTDVKIIAGYNNNEWLFGLYMDRFRGRYFDPNVFRDSLNTIFDFRKNLNNMEAIVRHFYIGDGKVVDHTQQVINFLSDFDFLQPVQRCLNNLLDKGATVYHYLFSYSGKRNWLKHWYSIREDGATHADELAYLFTSDLNKEVPNAEDQYVIDSITRLWTNFVKFGDPTPSVSTHPPVKWWPISRELLNYVNIDHNVTVGTRPFHDRLAFWEVFYCVNEKHMRWKKWRTDNNTDL